MAKVIIIGAGLAGSLLAIYLAKRGIEVEVYEARGDMRQAEVAAGRSINLALSDRGIAALREVGMDEYMLAEAVPMLGRMIHSVSGETKLLPYSGRQGEYINSVSRAGLNIALMNEAEKYEGVKFYFNERCVDFDCDSGEAKFGSGKIVKGDTLIATDGAGSAVREAMEREIPGFELSQVFLEHGYKELHIPPGNRASLSGGLRPPLKGDDFFLLEKNALHIWPRYKFMMIALPNFDGSFTCTLFLANKGENSFEAISQNCLRERAAETRVKLPANAGSSDILDFFMAQFPDAVPLMPTLEEDFAENPVGLLGTIKCYPWHAGGKALLLGDSAHAVVPFYGQGMNCAFEDCRVLDALIEKHGTDWDTVFEQYQQARKINTDAIADMAEENFYEMRDATADPVFQRKRELETKLEQTYPDYFSKYSMVTFREDLPYSVAKARGNAQDKLLMEMCAEVEDVKELDLNEVIDNVRLQPFLNQYKANLNLFNAFIKALDLLIENVIAGNKHVVNVQSRLKTWESLANKLKRKNVNSIFDISDIAGFLILVDTEKGVDSILESIQKEFFITSRYLSTEELSGSKYTSAHLTVEISSERTRFIEWKLFEKLQAEIRIQTSGFHVLENANHLLKYKSPLLIPVDAKIHVVNDLAEDLNNTINEFEQIIERPDVHEKRDIHGFLLENNFLIYMDKDNIWSEVEIGLGKEHQMDFMYREPDGTYCLVEIENPRHKLFNKNGDFSSAVNHALRQVEDWQEWIEDNLSVVQKKFPDISSPLGFVVIGRSKNLSKAELRRLARRNINTRGRMKIITYDELINIARTYVNSIKNLKPIKT